MSDKKEAERMFGPLWGQYWIQPGMDVYHRNDIDSEGKPKSGACPFVVDKVDKQTIPMDGGKTAYRIKGIVCHWYNEKNFQKALFFTKELVPKDVVDKGMLLDWLKR